MCGRSGASFRSSSSFARSTRRFVSPSMRRHTGRFPKRASEVAGGQMALAREIRDGWVAREISFDELLDAPKLPRRESRAD